MGKERIIWLLLLSGAIAFVTGKTLNRGDGMDFRLKTFWIQKTFASPVYDIVLLGDSRTYRGIDPHSISEVNGNLEVLNFGYSSAGFSNEYMEAGISKLSPNGKRVVVFCITPFSLTNVACKNEHFLLESARKKEEVLEAKYFSDLMFFFRPVDPQFYLQGKYADNSMTDSLFYHQEPKDNGWVASWKLKHVFGETVESYKKEFENNLPQQAVVKNIIDRVQTLKKRGFKVIGFRLPVQKDLYAMEESVSGTLFNQLEQGFKNSGASWLDIPAITNKTYDASHLDKWGAISLSKHIGKNIQVITR